jgi:DNA-binding winged helix-turn-helix (wHTH) protein/alpha-beta hydrolase superfamily lysophospholipase
MGKQITFGRFRFEPPTTRLWAGEREIKLTPKAAAVLAVLVARAGEPVTKQELFATVWSHRVVSDDALTTCIQELRKALADDAKKPRYIQTRHRSGYQFIAALSPPRDSVVPPDDLVAANGRHSGRDTLNQRIAFVRSKGRANIAYALSGSGPPLVRAGTWLTHVQHDWESPLWSHWLRFMSSRHTLVRYDPRGCGLSQADVADITFDAWVEDLETVVDRLGLKSFPLFGMSQGAAVAAEYAIRHPQRVTQLTLYAPMVTGWRGRTSVNAQQWQSMEQLVLSGWGEANMAFPSMFAHLFLPESPPEIRQWYAELQRKTASKEVASRFMKVLAELHMFSRLKQVAVPTLVIQIADDQVINQRTVAGIAGEIPGSEFVSIEGRNHVLLEDEPGWEQFKTVFTRHVPSA